jgi:hypothetical protein
MPVLQPKHRKLSIVFPLISPGKPVPPLSEVTCAMEGFEMFLERNGASVSATFERARNSKREIAFDIPKSACYGADIEKH